jgi:hypothetical protein
LSLGLLLHAIDIFPLLSLGIFFMIFEKSLIKKETREMLGSPVKTRAEVPKRE